MCFRQQILCEYCGKGLPAASKYLFLYLLSCIVSLHHHTLQPYRDTAQQHPSDFRQYHQQPYLKQHFCDWLPRTQGAQANKVAWQAWCLCLISCTYQKGCRS